jgi:hypothetical protein
MLLFGIILLIQLKENMLGAVNAQDGERQQKNRSQANP